MYASQVLWVGSHADEVEGGEAAVLAGCEAMAQAVHVELGRHRAAKEHERADVRNAAATIPSDKEMMLDEIASTIGVEQFNGRVRGSMLAAYERIATTAGMR